MPEAPGERPGQRSALRLERRNEHPGKTFSQRLGRRFDGRAAGKPDRVIDGIDETDGSAFERGLADMVRDDWRFHPQVRACDQDAVEPGDIRDVDPEPRPCGIVALVAKIRAPQTVIDAVTAEVRGQLLEQVKLLDGRARTREHADGFGLVANRALQRLGSELDGLLP